MAIVIREDGAPFAVYTYRELLAEKKSSLLIREIELLQEENGNYARIFQQETGDYEVVFARQEAYLLGETVWEYFDSPDDLIYCEALPGAEEALLVVVRAGSIFLEAKLSVVNLVDEFLSLTASQNAYDIYISGDVPLSDVSSDDAFAFDPVFVNSFHRLDEPIFSKLPRDEDYRLLPVLEAMEEMGLKAKNIPKIVAVTALVLVLGYVIWGLLQPDEVLQPVTTTVKKVVKVDPYQDYKNELSSPSPSVILAEMVNDVRLLYTMPGWSPLTLVYASGEFTADIEPAGGSAALLLAWIKENNLELQVSDGKISLQLPASLSSRPVPTLIYNKAEMTTYVVDQLRALLPPSSLSIGKTTKESSYKETQLNFELNDISADVLLLFAEELSRLPVVLKSCSLEFNHGLLSGDLQLLVLGS